jgi:membrane-bound lytic murein transglycosylase B
MLAAGLDSLGAVELRNSLEGSLQVQLPSTLAFDYPPRSRFFRSELEQFLLMVREQGFEPTELKGSYAGAMGYGQFIASSYRHYAVDFDGDDVADIFYNPVDAIGSVAHYFEAHHWRPGGPVTMRLNDDVQVPDRLMSRELKPRFTVSDFRNAGVKVPGSLAGDEPARIVRVEGAEGPQWWLTCHNFYVITRYNHSHLYAMAVHELAGKLAQGLAGAAESGAGPDDEVTD